MRNTVQQEVIARVLEGMHNHPTADEVFCAVKEEMPTVGKATVYRVLNRLADQGCATKVKINNGADRFDHQTHAHSHVLCRRCGAVADVDWVLPADMRERAQAQSHGFMLMGQDVQFDGLCPACQKIMEEEA